MLKPTSLKWTEKEVSQRQTQGEGRNEVGPRGGASSLRPNRQPPSPRWTESQRVRCTCTVDAVDFDGDAVNERKRDVIVSVNGDAEYRQ